MLDATRLGRLGRPVRGEVPRSIATRADVGEEALKAVAMMESDPPFSMFRAAPKKRLGFCRALASTPPDNILPEEGLTVL